MDKIKQYLKNKRSNAVSFLAALIAVGVILMCIDKTGAVNISGGETAVQAEEPSYGEDDLEKRLERLLSSIDGVGSVEVMITYKTGKEIVAAVDSTEDIEKESKDGITSEKRKTEKKLVLSDSKSPVVIKELYPKAEGVVIVAQGAENEQTRQGLIAAAKALLNVEEHKIEVLKMK